MRFIKEKLLKSDNKGMSLVELICSIAILAIIGTSISGVLIVSANSYNRGNSETKVQQEAQLVANQINDLLIDATADVSFDGTTLSIKQGVTEYQVIYDAAAQELNYQEIVAGVASDKQLMASGVTGFDVDVTDFSERGYVRLDLTFARDNQNYPAVFTMTARNKDTTAATTILAAIHLPNEIILEPNQSYVFTPTTTGLTNTALTWALMGDTDSSVTHTASNGTVTVGNNETASMFRVRVSSVETGPTGAPRAQKFVNVYVRRVNDISITGTRTSGVEYMSGATYQLKAEPLGNNLAQAPGADYDEDYVSPYQMEWVVTEGLASISVNSSDTTMATITLSEEMPEGSSVKVKATAKHPAGTNKTGIAYASVEKTWTLTRIKTMLVPGGGWLRQTNTAQAEVSPDIGALKQSMGGTVHRVKIRFREYPNGTFTDWLPNVYGDADNSMSINLRPLLTGVMQYDKDYELQIKLIIEDNEGKQVWPTEGVTPEDTYMYSSVVERVGITFNSDINMLNMTDAIKNDEAYPPTIHASKDNGFVLMEMNRVKGVDINGTSIENSICYILEKKQSDGTWKDVTNASNEIQQRSKTCRVTFRNDNYRGNYRVKVYVAQQPNNKLAPDNKTIIAGNPSTIDYILYDEDTGYGIYYFNVN